MKKTVLMSLIFMSVNIFAWNPFGEKKSPARKAYEKAVEAVRPLAPFGIQIVGGFVIPIAIAMCMNENYEHYSNTEKVLVRSSLSMAAISTVINGYQLHESGKQKKTYDKKSIVYAAINQLGIFATLYGLHKLDTPFHKEFSRK